jgi:hypothetical protein
MPCFGAMAMPSRPARYRPCTGKAQPTFAGRRIQHLGMELSMAKGAVTVTEGKLYELLYVEAR